MEEIRFTPEDPDDDVLRKLRSEREAIAAEIAARAAHVRGTGVSQHAGTEQMTKLDARHARDYEYALKSQSHLWVATTAYKLSDEAVDNMTTTEINLDLENMLMSPAIGCFICEEPFTRRLRHRKCAGEPVTSD